MSRRDAALLAGRSCKVWGPATILSKIVAWPEGALTIEFKGWNTGYVEFSRYEHDELAVTANFFAIIDGKKFQVTAEEFAILNEHRSVTRK